jgi:hypothetical protein
VFDQWNVFELVYVFLELVFSVRYFFDSNNGVRFLLLFCLLLVLNLENVLLYYLLLIV